MNSFLESRRRSFYPLESNFQRNGAGFTFHRRRKGGLVRTNGSQGSIGHTDGAAAESFGSAGNCERVTQPDRGGAESRNGNAPVHCSVLALNGFIAVIAEEVPDVYNSAR